MKVDPNELPGFHFVGSSAHPGSGIPFVLSSARIAAMKILAGE
jgi:phytoene dehydrogenase-like protein